MHTPNYRDAIQDILDHDPRYHEEAYTFVREGLDYTLKHLPEQEKEGVHHVSGLELLNGIRAYALDQFGPVTLTVFAKWGVRCCADFGEIVFNMVEAQILGKTEEDRREDFHGVFEFHEAFAAPYLPSSPAPEYGSNA